MCKCLKLNKNPIFSTFFHLTSLISKVKYYFGAGFAAYVLADRCGRRSTLVVMFGLSSVIEAVRAVADSSECCLILGSVV